MPINEQIVEQKTEAYKPSKADKDFLLQLQERIAHLKMKRSMHKANPYDLSKGARTVEQVWDFADFVSLPHRYSDINLEDWMADQSIPMIYAKIETAISVLIAKNPEIEITPWDERYEGKAMVMEALYNKSWYKGRGRQQLIKFMYCLARLGSAVGREYHRYETQKIKEVVKYDPVENKHITEDKEVIKHDEAYFEMLPLRDVWIDDRAVPYDEDSVRDWYFEREYDYSTFIRKFPESKFPNVKYIKADMGLGTVVQDKANIADGQGGGQGQVKLGFYEDLESNELVITTADHLVLLYREPLLNSELSLVLAMWKLRNDFCIYGVGVPEILENSQERLDRVSNMTMNQLVLAISSSGFYGGTGNLTGKDMILGPKLKKLRDADKIQFVKVPMPDQLVYKAMDDIRAEAEEISGVTKTLTGEELGNTLGEAVLNREAGLRRLATPLENIEFALERQAKLRVNNLQRIYSTPSKASMIRNELGEVLDPDLYAEYMEERQRLGVDDPEFYLRYPEDAQTGVVFKNEFRKERLPVEKTEGGEMQLANEDKWLEITPNEIRGDFDVKVKAMSTIPVSNALEESRALETLNVVAQLPYTDIYKAEKRVLKKRKEDPDDWMKADEEIIQQQQSAQQAQQAGVGLEGLMGGGGGAPKLVSPNELEQPASQQGLSSQFTQSL